MKLHCGTYSILIFASSGSQYFARFCYTKYESIEKNNFYCQNDIALTVFDYFFQFTVAHLNLGLTYASLGSQEKALKIFHRIESIDDDGLKDPKTHLTTQVTALYNSGKLLLEMGRPLEAVTVLRKAENSAKAVNYQAQGILNVLGEAFHALNKTLEAERSFQAALQLKPDHIPAYLTYGKLLAKNVRIFILFIFITVLLVQFGLVWFGLVQFG